MMSIADQVDQKVRQSPRQTGRTPTILCIDDDPQITQAIELRLRNFDVNVICDFNGTQGLWDAVRQKPDLIITDLRMPHGEGQQVLECIKRNSMTSHIPVIVLTGQPGDDLAGRMQRRGAAAFLRKPAHYLDLLRAISQYIPLNELDWGPSQQSLKLSQAVKPRQL